MEGKPMTDEQRLEKARSLARAHNKRLEQLQADYAMPHEIRAEIRRYEAEQQKILAHLNKPVVGSCGGPNA